MWPSFLKNMPPNSGFFSTQNEGIFEFWRPNIQLLEKFESVFVVNLKFEPHYPLLLAFATSHGVNK